MRYNVYHGGNQFRRTNMSRKAAIEHYHKIKQSAKEAGDNIYIYSPSHDFYVSDYFLPDFLDLQSNFGKLMFEDNATLLSKEGEDIYKWNLNGKILLSTPTEIKHLHTLATDNPKPIQPCKS